MSSRETAVIAGEGRVGRLGNQGTGLFVVLGL